MHLSPGTPGGMVCRQQAHCGKHDNFGHLSTAIRACAEREGSIGPRKPATEWECANHPTPDQWRLGTHPRWRIRGVVDAVCDLRLAGSAGRYGQDIFRCDPGREANRGVNGEVGRRGSRHCAHPYPGNRELAPLQPWSAGEPAGHGIRPCRPIADNCRPDRQGLEVLRGVDATLSRGATFIELPHLWPAHGRILPPQCGEGWPCSEGHNSCPSSGSGVRQSKPGRREALPDWAPLERAMG